MTTIACNKNSIACDLQISWDSGYKFRTTTKVFGIDATDLIPEPFYVGYAGQLDLAYEVIEWLRNPDTVKRPKRSCQMLILTERGKIITFAKNPNPATWITVNEPFFSIGSGSNFAQASMLAGLSPKEAVLAASKLDINTGMGVKEYVL
jgi:hypothetical protein